jgi:hypothetical protein
MIVDVPEIDWVVTPGELKNSEDILTEIDTRMTPLSNPTELEVFPEIVSGVVEYGTSKLVSTGWGISMALLLATAAYVLSKLVPSIDQNTQDRKKNRRSRNQVCVSTLLRILKSAQDDISSGYAATRCLETRDNEHRQKRTYRSRA